MTAVTPIIVDSEERFVERVVALMEATHYERAYSLAREGLQEYPDSGTLHYLCGSSAIQCPDRIDAAEAHLMTALSADPESHLTLSELARLFQHQSRPKEAIEFSRQAVELAPESADVWLSHGWVEFDLGDFKKAVSCAERALVLDGDALYANDLLHFSKFNAKLMSREGAIAAYKKLLRDYPDSTRIHHRLGGLTMSSSISDSATFFGNALRQSPGDRTSKQNLFRALLFADPLTLRLFFFAFLAPVGFEGILKWLRRVGLLLLYVAFFNALISLQKCYVAVTWIVSSGVVLSLFRQLFVRLRLPLLLRKQGYPSSVRAGMPSLLLALSGWGVALIAYATCVVIVWFVAPFPWLLAIAVGGICVQKIFARRLL